MNGRHFALGLIAIVAAGILLYMFAGKASKDHLISGIGQTIETAQVAEPYYTKLNSETLGFVHLSKRGILPVVQGFERVRQRFQNSSLWKKLQLEQTIGQEITKGIEKGLAEEEDVSLPGGKEDLEQLKQVWELFSTFDLVVSEKQFKVEEDVSAPFVLVRAEFVSDRRSSELIERFRKEFEKEIDSRREGKPSIAADPNVKGRYLISKIESGGEQMIASLSFRENEILAMIGAKDEQDFLVSGSASGITYSSAWRKLGPEIEESPGFLLYGELGKAIALLGDLIEKLEVEDIDGTGKELQKFKELLEKKRSDTVIMASYSFAGKWEQKLCFAVQGEQQPSSKRSPLYDQENLFRSDTTLTKLMSDRTIFALGIAKANLVAVAEGGAQPQFFDTMLALSEDEEVAQLKGFLEMVQSVVDAGIGSLGVIVNTASFGPVPDILFFVETEAGKVDQVMKALARIPSQIPELDQVIRLKTVSGNDGENEYEISLGDQADQAKVFSVRGRAISNDKVLFSSNPLAVKEYARTLPEQKPYFTSSPELYALSERVAGSSYLMYFNDKPLLDMAKGLMFFVQAQLAEKGVQQSEVDEFFELLLVRILNTQRSKQISPGVNCTVSTTEIF